MRKLAVVGSREYPRLDLVCGFVVRRQPDTVIVSGGAWGVDAVAIKVAIECGREWEVWPVPSWEWVKSKRAGLERNQALVSSVDGLVAFWDGKSTGTRHAISLAKKKGIPVWVFGPDGERLESESL